MLPQVSTQRLEWRVQHEGGHASTSTRGTVRMAGALRVGRASTSVRWTVGLQGATSRGGHASTCVRSTVGMAVALGGGKLPQVSGERSD